MQFFKAIEKILSSDQKINKSFFFDRNNFFFLHNVA